MGKGKYVTLDSYPETHETRGGNIFVVLLSLALATITATSLLGVDITKTTPEYHGPAHCTNH